MDEILPKLDEPRRIFERGVDEERLFIIDVLVVGFRSMGRVCQREKVALENLVAKLAAEKKV